MNIADLLTEHYYNHNNLTLHANISFKIIIIMQNLRIFVNNDSIDFGDLPIFKCFENSKVVSDRSLRASFVNLNFIVERRSDK